MQENTETTRKLSGECYCNSLRHDRLNHPVTGCIVRDCECRRMIAATRPMFDALLSISRNTCCDRCPEATLIARPIVARIIQFGPNAHAGVWISDEDAKRISEDGP